MSLETILETLSADMVKRGVSKEALKTMTRLELAIQLLDTYVKYPLPSRETALIPYNYCAAPKLLSGDLANYAKEALKYFCEHDSSGHSADL
jgi:hypothetical protein